MRVLFKLPTYKFSSLLAFYYKHQHLPRREPNQLYFHYKAARVYLFAQLTTAPLIASILFLPHFSVL